MNVITRGLTYMKPYLGYSIGAFFSMLLVTASNLVYPQAVQYLIDEGITPRALNAIWVATGLLLGIAIVRGIFSFTNTYWSETASQGVAYDLRNQIFTKLERLSFSYHDTHNVGQLMTRTTSDVEGVRTFFAQGILQLISALITFFGSLIILLMTDWRLALAAMAVFPVIILIFVMIFSRMGPLFGTVQRNLGQLNNILQETLSGIRVVKGFTSEPREFKRYDDQNALLYSSNIRISNIFSLGFPTIFFLTSIATLIVIWYGGARVIDDHLSLGTLIAFNSYLAYLVEPIFQIGGLSQQLSRAQASGKRIFEILDAESDIDNPHAPVFLPKDAPAQVTFENIHFHYPGQALGTLYDLDLEVPAGATVALLGPTGSGKSSILNLVSRFYDATEGRVLIDGIDVRDYDLDSLRHGIGVVLQSVRLASGTVADNIRYGAPEATDEQVIAAAKTAQAHDFIMGLDNGYETMLGEGGKGLSGGQRQRIAIARALVVEPRILIFDDSMSAVDAETEVKLRAALDPYLKSHTAFIIAQRISTVKHADIILVVDQGRVVAQGTHKELLSTSDLYVSIANSQLEE